MGRRKADKNDFYGMDSPEVIQLCLACTRPSCTNCISYRMKKGAENGDTDDDTGAADHEKEPLPYRRK